MSTRSSRALAGTLTSVLQYGVLMILQFLLVPVVLKLAGQEVLGCYSFILQIIGWAALTDLGFGVSTSRNLAQTHANDDEHAEFALIFTTGRTFFLGTNIVFSIIVFFVGWNIRSFLPMSPSLFNQAQISIYLLAIWIAIRTPLSLYGEALIATQHIAPVNIITAITNFVRLVLSLVLVAFGASLIGLVISYIVAEVLTLYLQKWKYDKLFPNDVFGWGIPNKKLFKEMLAFGFTFLMMSVAGRLISSTDSIIIGNILGASAVAIYYVSQMPGTLLFQLIWKISDNSAPALNELFYKGEFKQIQIIYFKLLRYSLFLAVPLGLGLLVFNMSFITLWAGIGHFAGLVFTIALAIYAITQIIIHLNAIILVVLGDIKMMSLVTIILSIVKVLFSFYLVKNLGLKGLMLSNVIIDLPILIYLQAKISKSLNLSYKNVGKEVLIPIFKSNILLVLLSTYLIYLEVNPSILQFIFSVALFMIICILGIVLFGISKTERGELILLTSSIFK